MTKLQAIRNFMDYATESYVTIARDRCEDGNWAMDISNSNPRLKIPADLNRKQDESDKAFRRNFIERCPLAQGFSSVTLTLLHECGHWATRSVMNIIAYDEEVAKAYTQEAYMDNPWETLATQWAICWLLCPENRKRAKKFEKEYFG